MVLELKLTNKGLEVSRFMLVFPVSKDEMKRAEKLAWGGENGRTS